MSGVSRHAECASYWQLQRSSSCWQWRIRLQDLRHQEELRGRFRKLVSDRMHRARTGSSQPHLGMRAGSGAIGHPQQQAEELKSQLFIAGAMICPSNRRQDQQLVPDLALAKSARMTQGIALSSWRRRLKRMKREKLDHRVSVIAFGQRSSPKASHCRETPPSTMVW